MREANQWQLDCKAYWLNQLSEAEQAALEEKYFADSEVFESVLAVKQQLILDYCRQRLTDSERWHFETYFLASSAYQAELKLCQGLLALEDDHGKTERAVGRANVTPWWRWLMPTVPSKGRLAFGAASLALALVIGGWLYSRSGIAPQTDTAAQQPQAAFGQEEYMLALVPEPEDAGRRAGSQTATPQARLTDHIGSLRLRLALPIAGCAKCSVEIKDLVSKSVVWQSSLSDSSNAKEIEIKVPREKLPMGDYLLTLTITKQSNPAPEILRYRFETRLASK